MKSLLVKTLKILLIIFVLIILFTGILLIFSQTGLFRSILVNQINKRVPDFLTVDFSIEKIEGNFFNTLEVHNIKLNDDKNDIINIEKIILNYNLMNLHKDLLEIEKINIVSPAINLLEENNAWNISNLVKERETEEVKEEKEEEPFNWIIKVNSFKIENAKLSIKPEEKNEHIPTHISNFNFELASFISADTITADILNFTSEINWHDTFYINLHRFTLNFVMLQDDIFVDNLLFETDNTKLSANTKFNIEDFDFSIISKLEFLNMKDISYFVSEIDEDLFLSINKDISFIDNKLNTNISFDDKFGKAELNLTMKNPPFFLDDNATKKTTADADKLKTNDEKTNPDVNLETDDIGTTADADKLNTNDTKTNADAVKSDTNKPELQYEANIRFDNFNPNRYLTEKDLIPEFELNGDIQINGNTFDYEEGKIEVVIALQELYVDSPVYIDSPITLEKLNLSAILESQSLKTSLDFSLQNIIDFNVESSINNISELKGLNLNGSVKKLNLENILNDTQFKSNLNLDFSVSSYDVQNGDIFVELNFLPSYFFKTHIDDLFLSATVSNEQDIDLNVLVFSSKENVLEANGFISQTKPLNLNYKFHFPNITTLISPWTDAVENLSTTGLVEGTIKGKLGELEIISDLELNNTIYDEMNLETLKANFVVNQIDTDFVIAGKVITENFLYSIVEEKSNNNESKPNAEKNNKPKNNNVQTDDLQNNKSNKIKIDNEELNKNDSRSNDFKNNDFQGNDLRSNDLDLRYLELNFDAAITDTDFTVKGILKAENIKYTEYEIEYVNLEVGFAEDIVELLLKVKESEDLYLKTGLEVLLKEEEIIASLRKLDIYGLNEKWNLSGGGSEIVYKDDYISVKDFNLSSAQQNILIDGIISFEDAINFNVEISELNLIKFLNLFDTELVSSGILDMNLILKGTFENPNVSLGLNISDITLDRLKNISIKTDINYTPEKNETNGLLNLLYEDTSLIDIKLFQQMILSFEEGLKIDDNMDGYVNLKANDIDISIFQVFIEDVKNLKGILNADIKLNQPMQNINPEGHIIFKGGSFNIPDLATTYRDVEMNVVLSENKYELKSLGMKSAGGSLAASALYEFKDNMFTDDAKILFNLSLNSFPLISTAGIQIVSNSKLNLQGTLNEPVFDGFVNITRGRINLDYLLNGGFSDAGDPPLLLKATPISNISLDDVIISTDEKGMKIKKIENNFYKFESDKKEREPARDLIVDADEEIDTKLEVIIKTDTKVISEEVSDVSEEKIEIPFDIKNLRGEVSVKFDRNFWVRSSDMNIELSCDLKIVKRGDDFEIFGVVSTVRGFYEFFGKRFIIEKGEVIFAGGSDINPDFSISLIYTFRGSDMTRKNLRLLVRGNLNDLDLEFELNNQRIEEADAIAYILFGRTFDELSQGEKTETTNSAMLLGGMLAGQLTDRLASFVGEQFQFDHIEFSSDAAASQIGLEVGKYLTDELFVSYKRDFNLSETTEQVYEEIMVEYQVNRFLFLQAIKSNTRTTGVDLIWRLQWD